MKVLRTIAAMLASCGVVVAAEPGDLWSLKPIGIVQAPAPAASWERNAIDTLIGGNSPQQADRRSLVRRASYDLTGLPPAGALVQKFVVDPRPDADAFVDVVESMLASKHYGEHWARHWLDVVRYADTAGENSDHPLPHAWRYRNWVIDAFNDDKPYDEFVEEQIAGDLLERGGSESIIATGYLAIARRFGHDIDQSMHLTYDDAIDNLGKAFLGLSISCARCHDHKHDPIPTRDYYALYGVLESTKFSFPGCEPKQQPRDLVPIASGDALAEIQAWEKQRDILKAKADAELKTQGASAKALKDLAAQNAKTISKGDVLDAGSVLVTGKAIELKVRMGEALQLSILPRASHGADTTVLEFSITQGEKTWSTSDLLDGLLDGNPNGTWCFLDMADDPKFLSQRHESLDGKSELQAWKGGDTPSVFVNTSNDPVKMWTTLPPRTFFVHPGPRGPVALAWLSPIDGAVSIHLKISDGHPGGDGVAWQLEHFSSPGIADAYRNLGTSSSHQAALAKHAATMPALSVAYAVAEGKPTETKLQLRGDPEDLGEEVPRAFLSALGGGILGSDQSSGRLELAERIANRDNPLTARVMANRIWAWHFGTGIVATPNDFGNHGAPPTHPQLLDFLAREFMNKDWSIKSMHRLVMNSATYQQSAREYSLMAPRRISAEELRDTLLVASDSLDRVPGEGHPFPPESSWIFTQHNPFSAEFPTDKRSVYVMRKRNRSSRFCALFNAADPNASTASRDVTTAATQALYFMNDPFFHSCAKKFSSRILAHAEDTRARLDFACMELFARPSTDDEVTVFEEFATALAAPEVEIWNAYARVLLGSNELLHID